MGFIIYIILTSPFLNPSNTLYIYTKEMQDDKLEILDINITIKNGDFFVSDEKYFDFDLICTQETFSQKSCLENKAIIGVEITPLDKKQNEWKFFKDSDMNLYSENARVIKADKFAIVSDILKYHPYKIANKFELPQGNYGNFKKITRVELTNGKYNIKVNFLEFKKASGAAIFLKISESWKKQLIIF